ncbi:MAG: hypothetical protein FWG32_09415 [Oscillospiraceae bacterium]|nr:hypothetical protein [Oscillospiraceae bacterium]
MPKRDRDNKKEKKKSGKKKKKKTDEKEKKPDNKNRIRTLIKIIPKTLGRLKQKLSIDVLKIYWTAAAEDPFDAAMQFGRVSEIEGIIAPFADKYLKVGTWDLKTNINFAISKPVIYVEFKATYQVWEILYIAGAFVTEYLIMISKLRREHAETERKNENG